MRIRRSGLLIGLMLLIGAVGIVPLFMLASPVAAIQAAPIAVEAAPQRVAQADAPDAATSHEGQYIMRLAAGCGCHFTGADYSGGEEFSGGFGTVYARNLTSDPETGLGNWTAAEIETAIRTGRRQNGEQLFGIMPYELFSQIAEDDMDELVGYLQTLDPVSNTIPARQLNFPLGPFTPTVAPPATAPVSGSLTITRGGYIVNALADCRGCHGTNLAGQFSPGLGLVPNITPDAGTGIGDWSASDIASLLLTGNRPNIPTNDRFNGQPVGGAMAGVIQLGFQHLTQTDAESIGLYLKTVEAVQNVPQAPVQAGIDVTKTVGTDANACAANSTVTVAINTQVFYCVTIENSGEVTLTEHTIDDPLLGLNATFPLTLTPGASVVVTNAMFGELGPVVATADVTNTVTVTSTYVIVDEVAPVGVEQPSTQSVTDSAQAVVDVQDDPTGLDEEPQPLERRIYLPSMMYN